jgi:hypothetical protein
MVRSPRNRGGGPLYSRALGSLFRRLLRLAWLRWRYSNPPSVRYWGKLLPFWTWLRPNRKHLSNIPTILRSYLIPRKQYRLSDVRCCMQILVTTPLYVYSITMTQGLPLSQHTSLVVKVFSTMLGMQFNSHVHLKQQRPAPITEVEVIFVGHTVHFDMVEMCFVCS